MNAAFQAVKRSWWWMESNDALERFTADSFAQGFELLRRSPRVSPALAASNCPPELTWKNLYRSQRDYFTIGYRRTLISLGLHKRVWAGPGGITFDATQSNDTLLKALEAEMRQPTPFGCGSIDGDRGFRIVARFKSHREGEGVYTSRPTDKPLWSHSRHEKQVIHLPLPRYARYKYSKRGRELSDMEALAYFRNFIKDNPPPDFAAYRDSLPQAIRRKRALDARPLALGLMAFDYSQLPDSALIELARWLTKTLRGKNLFDLDETGITKALYNGKARVNSLLQRLDQKS